MSDNLKIERMKEVNQVLQKAARAYYQENREIMSNYEYDALYDELLSLEKETGVILSGSMTQRVGYEILSSLPKEAHESPMLSLDKTKEVGTLVSWIENQKGILSWKMDGLTIVLTYNDGKLVKAVTRGNGEIGEVITPNAKVFANVPLSVPYKGQLVLRGEAIIKYSDFKKINEEITDADAKYKNPRNLCSGSVRQLNSEITAKRNVHFIAFALVSAQDIDFGNSVKNQFLWLKEQGFDTVEFMEVDGATLPAAVQTFSDRIASNDFPSDGLVLTLDDIAYGSSLGSTAKFPRNSIAFKWADEVAETKLSYIEWSASRTGLINPVAVFDPVELEGTTVSRASVHNVSIVKALELGIGDRITVYKANMIIPQVAENLTRSSNLEIPSVCPVCGGKTEIKRDNDVEVLYCTNPDCQAKKIKRFALFASRDAMNIDGLSEATLEKFIDAGMIHELSDIFGLDRYKDNIVTMEGFGEKSFANLMTALENAKHTNLARFIYGLGIENIGVANAKMISKAFKYDYEAIKNASADELQSIEGIGSVIAEGIVRFFRNEKSLKEAQNVYDLLTFEEEEISETEQKLDGKVFVITGSVTHFANRNEVKALIESLGGKVTGSVTSKTSYLINNDVTSNSSKNKKAKELNVPILSEEDFLRMIGR